MIFLNLIFKICALFLSNSGFENFHFPMHLNFFLNAIFTSSGYVYYEPLYTDFFKLIITKEADNNELLGEII